jgi:uncharacterized membrane protein HdeD (DUF308 family)
MPENAYPVRDVADMVADVGGSRWWWAGYGVLNVIVGLLAIAWPGATIVVLAIVFAVQLFVLGVFRIVLAFAIPDASPAAKVLSVVLGVLALIVGVLCLRSPQQTVVVLTLVLGGFWLIHGVVDIVAGIDGRGQPGRGWTIVGGVVGLVGGIVVLASPEATAVTFAWLLGILLVLQGVIAIVVAVKLPRTTAPATRSSAGAASRAPSSPDPATGSTTRLGATPDAGRHASG